MVGAIAFEVPDSFDSSALGALSLAQIVWCNDDEIAKLTLHDGWAGRENGRHMLFCNKRTMEEATAGEIRDRKSMDRGESQT